MENKFYLVGTNELSVNINKPTVIFKEHYFSLQGFLGGSDGKASVYNEGDWGSTLGWEDPLEKKWQSTPVLLPGKSHGQRSLVGYSPWGRKE